MKFRSPITGSILASFALVGAALAAPEGVDDTPPNFVDHVEPIFDDYCMACHRGSRARNGLQLSSVPKILAGGSSGAAIVPGDPDSSLLVKLVEHAQGPFMPPDEAMLPAEERATLRAWIAGGARVDKNDAGAPAPKAEAAPLPTTLTGGPAPMPPDELSREPLNWTDREAPLTALAASPGAPLAAVGGLGQVSLYALPHAESPAPELLGVLPFPEGRPERLSFSATGAVLLVAGGRAGARGLAVGFDVATGERIFAVGDEPETVLDADVTADLSVVVLGGPDRVLRAYDPASGALRWESRAHTDWVTAVAASPDSALVVSGDRAGGLVVLESFTGREFQRPSPSRGAVTGLAWRADGARFAVADESGTVRVFEAESGKQLYTWAAHKTGDGGALDVAWLADGGLVTVGRDGGVRVTDGAGKVRGTPRALGVPTLAVAAVPDGSGALVADRLGRVHVLSFEGVDGAPTPMLAAYPPPAPLRALRAAEAEAEAAAELVAASEAARVRAGEALAAAKAAEAEALEAIGAATSVATKATAAVTSAEALVAAARACVGPLEAARAAAEAAGAEAATLARWDELCAAARAEVERSEAAEGEARAGAQSATEAIAAAKARVAERGADQGRCAAALEAAESEFDAARAAHAARLAEVERLDAEWGAERAAAGE